MNNRKSIYFTTFVATSLFLVMLTTPSLQAISSPTKQNGNVQSILDLEQAILSSDVIAYYSANETIHKSDGIIGQNEYLDSRNPLSGFQVYIDHNSSHLFIGLVSQTLGWVAIGFNQEGQGMSGANLIMGNVESGIAAL